MFGEPRPKDLKPIGNMCGVIPNTPYINSDPRPRMPTAMGSINMRTLFDSGATHSAVNAHIGKRIIESGINLKPSGCQLTDVQGNRLTVIGSLDVPITVLNKTIVWPCLVIAQLAEDCILGSDFMHTNNISINFGACKIFFNDAHLEALSSKSITAIHRTFVPENHHVKFKCTITCPDNIILCPGSLVITNRNEIMEGVYLEEVITKVMRKNVIMVVVTNTNPYPVFIKPTHSVGTITDTSAMEIHIFVHVPLFDNNKVLDILQFHNAPTQISDLLALKLSPVDDILAVGKDGLHTSMSHTDLTSMTKYGHMYFSDTALTLNIQLNTSCLGMIYSQDFHNIKSFCPAKFLETDEQFTNVGPGEYIFYTSNPQTIQIRCQSGVKHLAVEHTEKIRLPDNCEVKSKNFVTRTGHDFNLESAIRAWPTTWNVSGLLFDLGATTLAVQVAKLKLIHYPAMPIRDLHRMMATTTAATHWWFTAPICAATTLLILIFAYLGLRYWQLRKNGPSAPAAAIEEAAA